MTLLRLFVTFLFALLSIFVVFIRFKALKRPARVVIVFLSSALSVGAFFFFRTFDVLRYVLFLNLFLTLVILSTDDIKTLSVSGWELGALFLSVMLLRQTLPIPVWQSGISVALGFLLLFVPFLATKKKGLGIGDVYAFTLLSLTLRPLEVFFCFFLSVLLALLFALLYFSIKKEKRPFPLLPFFSIAVFWVLPFSGKMAEMLGISEIYLLQFL